MIEIVEITAENWTEAIALSVRHDQERFVPSVALSLAKAYIKPNGVHYRPYGIFVGNMMVGFYCFMFRPHNMQVCYIGGFLIDSEYQGYGYGTATMKHFLEWVQSSFPECEGVYLTVHPENENAARFYNHFGFVKTGLVIDNEDAMALTFDAHSDS